MPRLTSAPPAGRDTHASTLKLGGSSRFPTAVAPDAHCRLGRRSGQNRSGKYLRNPSHLRQTQNDWKWAAQIGRKVGWIPSCTLN
jgi:hypothetical protein